MDRFRESLRGLMSKSWGGAALAAVVIWIVAVMPVSAQDAPQYPPLGDYLMPRDAEIALARSAAPASISDHATIKVLTEAGFETTSEGSNGFVCVVLRGWAAPTSTPEPLRAGVYDATVRAPICFDPLAATTVLPLQELRQALAMDGKNPEEIAAAVQAAYALGELPRMETVAFAYMFSANMQLGPGVGAYHPHMMIYTPYYENAFLGGNAIAGTLPFVSDDEGTPFAVTVIPVDHELAIEAATEPA